MQENENKNDLPARDDVTDPVSEPAEAPAVGETETSSAETVETAEVAEQGAEDPAAESPAPQAGQEAAFTQTQPAPARPVPTWHYVPVPEERGAFI